MDGSVFGILTMWALDLESDFSWKRDRTCKIDEELEAGHWREK